MNYDAKYGSVRISNICPPARDSENKFFREIRVIVWSGHDSGEESVEHYLFILIFDYIQRYSITFNCKRIDRIAFDRFTTLAAIWSIVNEYIKASNPKQLRSRYWNFSDKYECTWPYLEWTVFSCLPAPVQPKCWRKEFVGVLFTDAVIYNGRRFAAF